MKRQAFTLMEIMVVVVIVGVLAGLALPQLMTAMEIQKAEVAKRDLEIIKNAMVFLEDNNKNYVFCASSSACSSLTNINAALELDIHNSDFTFGFTFSSDTAASPHQFNAVRNGGPASYTLSIEVIDGAQVTCSPPEACAYAGIK